MRNTFFLISCCVVLIVFITLPACGEDDTPPFECADTIGCVTIEPGEPIELGVLQALSGGAGPNGLVQVRIVQ